MLAAKNLTKAFGGVKALDEFSFDVRQGSILGLIGPNGAGKTLTFDIITGAYQPDGGTVSFMGKPLTGLKVHEVALRGIVRTFQINRVFPKMTVMENILLATDEKGLLSNILSMMRAGREYHERALDMLKLVGLIDLRDELAGNLSYGQQKLLGLACALIVHPEPKLLLLDEPVAGVNRTLANRLLDLVRTMNQTGKTFIVIEHDMPAIMGICDKVIVLDHGKKIAEGKPQEIQSNERVIEAYFGR